MAIARQRIMHAHATAYEEGLRLCAEGRHADAIDRLQTALVERPDDTRVLFALGNTARALGMTAPAEQFYRMVLALEPERLEALINLANLLRANGNPVTAIALLEPALSRAPDAAEILHNLGSAHRECGDHQIAETFYREALARKPDCVAALVNLADLRANAGAREEALSFYGCALALYPGNAEARFHRAFLHLEQGDLTQGWRDYEARLALDPIRHNHDLLRWNGEAGTHVLVTAEQGVGDELMFASLIPDLAKRGEVTLECDPRLVPLFARSFPNVAVRASHIQKVGAENVAHHGDLAGLDCAIEVGSLPLHFRPILSNFPNPHSYLAPDPEEAARWAATFAAGPHIGICWRSGKRTHGRTINYAPLKDWADFLRVLPGTLVCAQYDADAEEIAELEALSGREILVPRGIDQKKELDRTAAMLSALDCVVSAPTAVSWLAGGAGVATCKILNRRSWTSFGTGHEPFAPSCLCFAPDRENDWADAFAKASAEIRARLR
jgi:tetratricopeptide (TPR) repeat protein